MIPGAHVLPCLTRIQLDMTGEIDASYERAGVRHEPDTCVAVAGPFPPATRDLRFMPVTHGRVGEEVVRSGRMMRGRLGMRTRAAGPGYREEPRNARQTGARQGIESELRGRRKAAGNGNGSLCPAGGPPDSGQPVGKAAHELGSSVRAVEFFIEREVLHSEVSREINHEAGA